MAISERKISKQAGFKQTEIGLIPEDWKISTVGTEFNIQLGKMLDTEKNVGTPKPYIGNKAVQWNHIDLNDLQTMAMSRSDLERFRLLHGDLLVCEGGEIGRAAIWEAPIEECYYQKALHRLRPLHGFNTRLMVALLQYWTYHGKLSDYVSQTSIAHLTQEKFLKVLMPLPPLSEQQAIATALSDVDALLTSLDKLIAKKRDIKQATMQELLTGKTRLPGFSGEWEMSKLGEIAKIYRGASPRPIEDPKWFNEYSSIGWVRISDVTKSTKYLYNTAQNLSEMGIKQSRFVKNESLIMSICATIGKPVITKMDVCIHDGFVVFESPKLDLGYLYYYLSSIEKSWYKNGQTGSQMNLNTKIIEIEMILFPINPLEQQAIATILSDMDAEIVKLEQKRDKTRALKQGMMQELLTGKTRLYEHSGPSRTHDAESSGQSLQHTTEL